MFLFLANTILIYTDPKTFLNATGYWEQVATLGGGGGTISYQKTYGVTNHEESEVTASFGKPVTKAISAGLNFGVIDVSGSRSSTYVSSEVAHSMERIFE